MNEQKKQDILSMFIRTTNPRCPNCETNSQTVKHQLRFMWKPKTKE
jgi:hypothetical protein